MTIRKPLISVLIPHLNQPQDLEACLSSLDAQSLARSLFEIIVVDNGSICVPEAIVERYDGTRLLQNRSPVLALRAISELAMRPGVFLPSSTPIVARILAGFTVLCKRFVLHRKKQFSVAMFGSGVMTRMHIQPSRHMGVFSRIVSNCISNDMASAGQET